MPQGNLSKIGGGGSNTTYSLSEMAASVAQRGIFHAEGSFQPSAFKHGFHKSL